MKRKEFQTKQLTINNTSGTTLTEPDDLMKRWKEYGEHLFDSTTTKESMASFDNKVREPPPLLHEVESAIKNMKKGKSPGLDSIPAEFLKAIQVVPMLSKQSTFYVVKYGTHVTGQKNVDNKSMSCYTRLEALKNVEIIDPSLSLVIL